MLLLNSLKKHVQIYGVYPRLRHLIRAYEVNQAVKFIQRQFVHFWHQFRDFLVIHSKFEYVITLKYQQFRLLWLSFHITLWDIAIYQFKRYHQNSFKTKQFLQRLQFQYSEKEALEQFVQGGTFPGSSYQTTDQFAVLILDLLEIQIKLLSMSRSKLTSTSSTNTYTPKVYSSAIYPSESASIPKETLMALRIRSKKMADYFYANNPESRAQQGSLNSLYEATESLKSQKKCEAVQTNPFLQAKLKYMLGESTRNTVQKKNIFTEDLQVEYIQNPQRTTGREKIKQVNEERERKISNIINKIRGDRSVSSQC